MNFRYGIFIGAASVLTAIVVGCVGHPAPESTVVISDGAEEADYYSDFAVAPAGSPMELDRPPVLGAPAASVPAPETPKAAPKIEKAASVSDYGTPPAPVLVKTAPAVSAPAKKAPVVAAVKKSAKAPGKTVERAGDCRAGETLTNMKSGEYACCPKNGDVCYGLCQSGETLTRMTNGGLACCPAGGSVCYPIVK